MIIRKAKISDYVDINSLVNEFGFECNQEEMKNRLSSILSKDIHKVLVAEIDNKVIGFVDFDHYEVVYSDPGINITGLIVNIEYRNKGVGTALLLEIEKYAKSNKMAFIRVNSGSQRIDAHKFYKKNGYDNEKDEKRFLKIF